MHGRSLFTCLLRHKCVSFPVSKASGWLLEYKDPCFITLKEANFAYSLLFLINTFCAFPMNLAADWDISY